MFGAVVELDEDDGGDVGAAGVEHVGMSVDVDVEDGKIERGAGGIDEKGDANEELFDCDGEVFKRK